MHDEILQHHFDEVFNSLQDQENFEIFTGMRPVATPKVKKTLVKIVRSAPTPPATPPGPYSQATTDSTESMSVFSLVSKNARKHSHVSPGIPDNQSGSSASIAGKLYFMPSQQERKKIASRNTLFECKNCGRYILGDFLAIHEEQCGDESISHRIH